MVKQSPRPLDGIRVLELGQLMAGPFAGTVLAYFGAEVIKIEPPGTGDPVRGWRAVEDGTSLWWLSLARNKKCITLDLRKPAGQALARRLAVKADVLIENFRPGTMERWGLGPSDLEAANPGLVYARVSGFGQTGPYAARPGFAAVCEAVGGLRYVTGTPGEPPVRANLSVGDTLAGLHAALGIALALLHRERNAAAGQVVDVAIYEAVFNLMEAAVPEYDRLGLVREPSGVTITGVVPTNLYPCADGRGVVIGANSESIYRRLMAVLGRQDLADDPALRTNAGRVPRQAEIDGAVAAWTRALPSSEVIERLAQAAVPAGPVNSVADMLDDPHFQSRGLVEEVEAGGRPLKIPAIVPRLVATPGRTDWPGPALGAHNREILGGLLGLTDEELARLEAEGTV